MKLLADFPEKFNVEAAMPAANHLFGVNDEAEKLKKEETELFHHLVAQLLFLCKRAQPDLQTIVLFLSTHVKSPDVDDKKKLQRTVWYLQATKKPLTLEADNLGQLTWWVDATFVVRHDMRSHTGGLLVLGKGATFATSTKQKFNT
eukprot:979430-Ditylum_brightwellii.AAC.1